MMKKHYKYTICLLFTISFALSQTKDTIHNSKDYMYIIKGDTLAIHLDEIVLTSTHKFTAPEDIHYYNWFKRKVFKAYPYAKLASERLDTLNSRLEKIKSKRQKRRYTKIIENYLEGEFTDQLKKLTKTEGRILINLIHRQTGKTVFEQVKDYKSGWNAFWYNATANIFALSLKDEYNPETENEDFLIENILTRAFLNGDLEEQPSKLKFNFNEIFTKKGGKIDVGYYKELFGKTDKKR